VVVLILGLSWLGLSIAGFIADNNQKWARKMFFLSLLIILTLSIIISLGAVLP